MATLDGYERQPERLHRQRERADLLVLDELGYVSFSKASDELLFEVVSRAYEWTSLIVTTKLPFESWPGVLGSERLARSLLDRLTHRAQMWRPTGRAMGPGNRSGGGVARREKPGAVDDRREAVYREGSVLQYPNATLRTSGPPLPEGDGP